MIIAGTDIHAIRAIPIGPINQSINQSILDIPIIIAGTDISALKPFPIRSINQWLTYDHCRTDIPAIRAIPTRSIN